MDVNTNLSALNEFFRLQISDQANQAAAVVQAPALSDAQMRDLLQGLADFNTGFSKTESGFGTTAIALPNIQPTSDMGSLSTADLLLLIRAESRKTTDLLIKNETDDIKAQEESIDVKREETNKQLDKAEQAMKKAESWGKAMKIAGGVLAALSVVATIMTFGAASATIIVAASLLMAVSMVPLPGTDGKTAADLGADGLSDLLQRMGMDEKAADWVAQGIILVLEIAAGIATGGAMSAKAVQGVGAEVATEVAEKVVEEAAEEVVEEAVEQVATEVGEKVAEQVAKEAAEEVFEKSDDVAKEAIDDTIREVGEKADDAIQKPANKLESMEVKAGVNLRKIELAGNVIKAGGDTVASTYDYKAQTANADAKELKATIAYLQGILEADADFVQMLMDISAKLDSGVATMVKNEFQANENRTYQAFS